MIRRTLSRIRLRQPHSVRLQPRPRAHTPETAARQAPAAADYSNQGRREDRARRLHRQAGPRLQMGAGLHHSRAMGYTTFVLEMTSQTWRSEADVDKPVWKHWMTIVKPDRGEARQGAALHLAGRQHRPRAHRRAGPLDPHREGDRLGRRRSRHGAEPAAALHRLEGQAALGRRHHRLHAREAFHDQGR